MVKSLKPRLIPAKKVALAKKNIVEAKKALDMSSSSLGNLHLAPTARKAAAQRGFASAENKIKQARSNVVATRGARSKSKSRSGTKSKSGSTSGPKYAAGIPQPVKVKADIAKLKKLEAKKPAAKRTAAKRKAAPKRKAGGMREFSVIFTDAKQGTSHEVTIKGSAANAAVKAANETGHRGMCVVYETGQPAKYYDVEAARGNPNLLHAKKVDM